MIRMVPSISASHAKSYFSDALLKTDYYLDDQELQGKFYGRLSNRIGLGEYATKNDFFALTENINPTTGHALTPRTKACRTIGYDINFHCPKSVSIIHALSKDDHILKAFQSSVHTTMKDIENDSMVRVRRNGKQSDRNTGELVWAEFTHQTARPIDGSTPDPHLHSHCFTFNATWDEQEKQIKACQFREINRDMPYYQARFHKTLSDKLIELGYNIKRTQKSFEIEGVPKSVNDLFSKRTDEIGRFAKEKGIYDPKQLSELGAKTRAKKQKEFSMAQLKDNWRSQIKDQIEFNTGEYKSPIRHAKAINDKSITPEVSIDFALNHTFERASVMSERTILATAYSHSIGKSSVNLESITKSFMNDKRVIRVKENYRSLCTMVDVLREEKKMVALAQSGKGRFAPIYDGYPEIKLDGQQGEAIRYILTTKDQVSIIRGVAGSGKTTLLKEAVELMEKAGKKITIVAPSSQASRDVLVGEGFEKANTVQKLLIDKKMQEDLKGQILIVDEAGLLGTKDTRCLLQITKEQSCRLILVGDTRQHSSVVRGDALRILNTVANIPTAEVNKIRRQRDIVYKEAVTQLSQGNVKEAFMKLDDMSAIIEVDPLKPNDDLVKDYVSALKKGKSALIISPTKKQGESVTEDLREKLKDAGLLGRKEVTIPKLSNLNFTEAQKSDWRNFEIDQKVRFSQNLPNIKRGSAWDVIEIKEGSIRLVDEKNNNINLPLEKATSFDVFNKSEIKISKGEKLKITRNSFDSNSKRLNNGTFLEVKSVAKDGKVTLLNTSSQSLYHLDKNFGDIDHAYCTTSHSSQGKTVDEVYISQPSSTFVATDAKQFYVSVSRGKFSAKIYTDDKENLIEYASELGERQSAIELTKNSEIHLDHLNILEIEKNANKLSSAIRDKPEVNKSFDKYNDYEPKF
ncbi:MAG: MobF family relaxase [Bacteroidota bacterium]